MVVLLSIYKEEDEAYQNLVTVATTFFQYLLQPFRDMRELACLYKMEILVNAQICMCVLNKMTYRNNRPITFWHFSALTVVCITLKLAILVNFLQLGTIWQWIPKYSLFFHRHESDTALASVCIKIEI